MNLMPMLLQASELGIRLEVVNGLPIWEAQPVYRHQKHVQRIANSIKPLTTAEDTCKCVYVMDVYVQFPAGLKRPDIAIFCREPSEAEQDAALTIIPEAVVEIVSKGYELKDLQIGPPFYLAQGVKDVVVFDPFTTQVLHLRQGQTRQLVSPVAIELVCGCGLVA